ncbi:MAG: phosphoserine phosphatase SerB [Alphaproteobacteria bacterium]|nr:phosphoserine phosphatase SerB [Alphaproteobacteria bacterium]
MQYVLTLTSEPNGGALTDARVSSVSLALAAKGATVDAINWLSPGRAVDLVLSGIVAREAIDVSNEELAGVPVDINAQPVEGRRKQLLIADMDSTIITDESLDELADFIGIRDEVAPITERAMRGEIDFDTALRDRVLLLRGQPIGLLDRLLAERIHLTGGAESLVRTMRDNGVFTALVSGGFTFVTEAVAARVGFAAHRGNILLTEGDILTGKVGEPILGKEAKLESLREFCANLGLALEQTMAVGDGANDIPMLLGAGTGVAFRAKPQVAQAARFRIDHGDLTALLYLQGYSDAYFVT